MKKHWGLVTMFVITLIGAGVLGYLIIDSGSKTTQQRNELQSVKDRKESINKFPFLLTNKNLKQAEDNAKIAWDRYKAAYDELYPANVGNGQPVKFQKAELRDMNPPEAKLFVIRRCNIMRESLRNAGVSGWDKMSFTLSDVTEKEELPPVDDIKYILRNLYIINEIIDVVADCQLTAINSLGRKDLKLLEHNDDFKYIPFTLSVTGNYSSIRTFINRIQDAKYMFIIRDMKITATDIAAGSAGSAAATPGPEVGPGAGRGKRYKQQPKVMAAVTGLPKYARIAYPEMSKVTVELNFDYMELVEHQPKNLRGKKKK